MGKMQSPVNFLGWGITIGVIITLFLVFVLKANPKTINLGIIEFDIPTSANISSENLVPIYKTDYLRMVIDSYYVNRDCDLVIQRYKLLGNEGLSIFMDIKKNPQNQNTTAIEYVFKCVTE